MWKRRARGIGVGTNYEKIENLNIKILMKKKFNGKNTLSTHFLLRNLTSINVRSQKKIKIENFFKIEV